jgi:hypothetical protein
MLLLVFLSAPVCTGDALAYEARQAVDVCQVDQLGDVKVRASAKFDHNGRDYSVLTSRMELTVPPGWGRAPDLLLDTDSTRYREALRCLLGKVDPDDFFDYEWRLKPLTVEATKQGTRVHYEAVRWLHGLDTYGVGPWELEARKKTWVLRLLPPRNLAGKTWEEVHVHLGGSGARSVSPPAAIGEEGTVLRWHNRKPVESIQVEFRPPMPQQWAAITLSREEVWEVLGVYSGSGAAWYVATGIGVLIVARRLRRSPGQLLTDEKERALRTLRSWGLLQTFIALVVYMGDNVFRVMKEEFLRGHDYWSTTALISLIVVAVLLCFFGRLNRALLITACIVTLSITGASIGSEVSEFALLPTSDGLLSPIGTWLTVVAYAMVVFVFWVGAFSAGQRVLLMNDGRFPLWAVLSASAGMSTLILVWAFIAFWRDWNHLTWLVDTAWSNYEDKWLERYDLWWWWFPDDALTFLWDCVALVLTPLVLVGALRVCRAEQHEAESFTPNEAERFLLVIFFAFVVLPGYGIYFGISGSVLASLLGMLVAWSLLNLARSRSVLERPYADGIPLGRVISQTDRSDLLRLARHYRELQERLHRLNAGHPVESTWTHEAIERDIDRLDQFLPEGIRPIDVAFACGPMTTWWGNACRCAIISCLVGTPATGLMYWVEITGNETWIPITRSNVGFIEILLNILYWHLIWVSGGFFLGALWRDLPGRYGPTKAFWVAVAFAIPVVVHQVIAELVGQSVAGVTGAVAAFASVMTFTGLVMDVQTFQSERRYWPSSASLVMYLYRMRFASVGFFLAQIVALATLWKALREGGPAAPPPDR